MSLSCIPAPRRGVLLAASPLRDLLAARRFARSLIAMGNSRAKDSFARPWTVQLFQLHQTHNVGGVKELQVLFLLGYCGTAALVRERSAQRALLCLSAPG